MNGDGARLALDTRDAISDLRKQNHDLEQAITAIQVSSQIIAAHLGAYVPNTAPDMSPNALWGLREAHLATEAALQATM